MNTTVDIWENSTALNDSLFVWSRYHTVPQLLAVHRPAVYYTRNILGLVWVCIGIPGNTLAFFAWSCPKLRSSSGIYLATGAVVDLFLLCYRLSSQIQRRLGCYLADFQVLCQLLTTLHYMCQYAHPLLILGFSIERCIAISQPFLRITMCTTGRAIKAVLAILLIALCFASVQAYFWHINDKGICDFRPVIMERNILTIWNLISETIMFFIVPVSTLLVNIYVVCALTKARKNRQHKLAGSSHGKVFKKTSTLTLLVTSTYDMLAELAVSVVYTIWPLFVVNEYLTDEQIAVDPQWQTYINYEAIKYIVFNICFSRYACNFYIYLATGVGFRNELKNIMMDKITRKNRFGSKTRTSYMST